MDAGGVSPSPLVSQWGRWAKTSVSEALDGPASPGVLLTQAEGMAGQDSSGGQRMEGLGGARLRCGQTLDGLSCWGGSTTCRADPESSKGWGGGSWALSRAHTHLKQRVYH